MAFSVTEHVRICWNQAISLKVHVQETAAGRLDDVLYQEPLFHETYETYPVSAAITDLATSISCNQTT